ncbi:RNA polymerase sigma factor (sigma-70 family) [Actinomycetospora succinea]|uniref:RNA polymerase sigma factor n=1 Tax=Actinomycetospora succinea TaxID=663603 RepID=A0A4R6UTD9_9PSEU|nr:sigma-70 family RNA polymerase sigma factor [Actinomycetospora succinea]TDQ46674.1 RNA polymerase sigma factor (sigma-70 family) [Actinomycetospora succinea]
MTSPRGGGVRARVDAVWKLESARIVAALTRMVHDVGLAEELAQDALVSALEQWPDAGVPDNPGAWLTSVAKRRAVDHLRRVERAERAHTALAAVDTEDVAADEDEDADVLRLMFLSCHPVLRTEGRLALTLRLLGGLSADEIARAFLVDEATIARRIADAKRTLADEGAEFAMPGRDELAARLSSVLEVVYLVFNEGYAATSGQALLRTDLCGQALRLGHRLAALAPSEPEVHGLLALMELQASRAAARTGPTGEPIPLHEQDRGRWDPVHVRRGFTAMLRARDLGGGAGPYVLQAAIAVCHAQARRPEDTDWAAIAALYDRLAALLPTPVVALNRAVAVARARGPAEGLALVEALRDDPRLRDYHLLPGVRADLLARLGRDEEARREYARAAALTRNDAERAFLDARAADLVAAPAGPTLEEVGARFLDGLDAPARRAYGQTLRRLVRGLGGTTPLAALTGADVARVLTTSWGSAAPATWNRHRAAARSFAAFVERPELAGELGRRASTAVSSASVSPDRVAALCDDPARPVRERALWSLLHESGAPVRAVLALDVTDLDRDDRSTHDRAVVWRSRTARLLEELLAGRSRGPVFLADRRPGPARVPAAADRCPDTGRSRLSYERAEYLFKQASESTLSRLRPRG